MKHSLTHAKSQGRFQRTAGRENLIPEVPPEVLAHLCEIDWSVFGNTISIFAGKHPTITSIHLLWNFLKDQQ
jgi:hypothetical protein